MSSAEASDPHLPSDVLRALVLGTAAEIGEEFFHELARRVAEALGTRGVWVTEWLADVRRLRALAFWFDGAPFGDYEYAVAGTPCEAALQSERIVHFPERVIELHPRDPDLSRLGAVSYLGVALRDTDGEVLGHLAALHDRPLPPCPRAEAIFRIFAGRAAAELRRLRRDRDLREREQELSGLIASAMDAIVQIDAGLAVRGMNAAAERAFACTARAAAGRPLARFLAPASGKRLATLATELARLPAERRSLWIPEGLEARRADGSGFPAEATLSGYELDGRACYALILRNVDERLAAERRIGELAREAAYLRAEVADLQGFDEIVGTSDALRAVLADLDRVAASDATVLLTGETGTGKELFARAIHRRSRRAAKPLVKVNCAAIAPSLQESEFFGHVKGAFTGATQAREGRFQVADGGTLFLDEVGEMPKDLQAKLLRVLQEGEFEPVGSARTQRVDVRVIAATNRDLAQMVAEGSFRSDLYYRLEVFPLRVPPLREREGDVVLLAETFAREIARRSGRGVAPLTAADEQRLRGYDWPGNVRELENVIERAFLTSEDGRRLNLARALPQDPPAPASPPAERAPRIDASRIHTDAEMRELERQNLVRALEAAGGKVSGAGGAAELLGLNPNTLASRLRSLGIERPRRRTAAPED